MLLYLLNKEKIKVEYNYNILINISIKNSISFHISFYKFLLQFGHSAFVCNHYVIHYLWN